MGKENDNTNNNAGNNTNTGNNQHTNNGEDGTKTQQTQEVAGQEIDAAAFADLIAAKDKELEELRGEINTLKKTNAEMLVRISAQNKPQTDIEQSIIDMFDTRKIK